MEKLIGIKRMKLLAEYDSALTNVSYSSNEDLEMGSKNVRDMNGKKFQETKNKILRFV